MNKLNTNIPVKCGAGSKIRLNYVNMGDRQMKNIARQKEIYYFFASF